MTLTLKYLAKYAVAAFVAIAAYVVVVQLIGAEVSAQDTGAAKTGLGLTGGSADGTAETSLGSIISTIIDILSIIVGALSVIMIIIGGLKYVVSSGDSSGTQSAKNTILYAIVGLVIVIFAQVIVGFVIDRVDGTGNNGGGGGTPDAGYVINIG